MSYSCFLFVLHCCWCQVYWCWLPVRNGCPDGAVGSPAWSLHGGGHRRATGSEYAPSLKLKNKKKNFFQISLCYPSCFQETPIKTSVTCGLSLSSLAFVLHGSLLSSHSEDHLWPILNPKQPCFINPLASEQISRCCPLPWWGHMNAWWKKNSLTARALKKCT